MDDPDFIRHIIGQMPAGDLQSLYEDFQEAKTGQTTWEHYLRTLHTRADALDVLRRVYEMDQLAKASKERWILNIVVSKRISNDPAKMRTDKITNDEIIEFYKSLQ